MKNVCVCVEQARKCFCLMSKNMHNVSYVSLNLSYIRKIIDYNCTLQRVNS